jgi:tripartite ATP-independent transporter DctM subunit
MNGELFGYYLNEEYLALAMVLTLFCFLMFGYPVAFTLAGVALFYGFIGLDLEFFNLLPPRIYGVMNNGTLLAVPLFIFMGVMLERSGIAERLLVSMSTLFGGLRSGLAMSVVLSGALLAASTGIVGASVVTMGLISLPIMIRQGYSPRFSTGVICSSGTLGQIIPPSIVLILLGDIMGVSVGDLFMAAVGPGIVLVVAYLSYAVIYCAIVKPDTGHERCKTVSYRQVVWPAFIALVPPAGLMFLVLGSIFFGVASPTEAAAIGAAGACILALFFRRLSWQVLTDVSERTLSLSCMVFMILMGAQAFGLVFRGLSGDDAIREIVQSLSYGPSGFLIGVMLLLFILGCFLDFIEIVFIVVPILSPLIVEFGYDPLWFSILIAVNLQMSFITPPFGFSLFYLKGVAPEGVSSSDIYRGIVPFVLLQALVIALIIVYPQLVTAIPSYFAVS